VRADHTDVVIVRDPDEYISVLLENPWMGERARAIVEWPGDEAGRTFMERLLGRLLVPSKQVTRPDLSCIVFICSVYKSL
jgi:hypothetical protein